ncbi:hypothetical protein PENTCL1PPCAC_15956 [Pristionchus entomophagus]|uniref:Nuclear receptor domain-containing protein n=1 Tax=Pristionchus entomophagus TaxID=358040 RepID=A0AAV5THJ6_9BILA|nr:hypothetical protein PENTCL1PPCAC_15956 [Pristionchus entomophagus]
MDSSSISGKCLICSTPNNSMSLGIDACRSCTSFFKRAYLSARRLTCRQGDRKCALVRAADAVAYSMCRGCRYDRCIAVGMEYERPLRAQKFNCEKADESLPSSSSVVDGKEDSLLDRIGRERAVCMERRRVHELELVKRNNLTRLPHPSEEVYLADYDCALAAFSISVSDSWQLLLTVFPSLRDLPHQDQREVFRLCVPQFAMLDGFSRTKRVWGDFAFSKYAMCSALICTDMESPEQWIGERKGGPNTEEMLECVRAFHLEHLSVTVPSFEKAAIHERETDAMLALMLCESELQSDLSECLLGVLKKVRAEILGDLHRFYTEEMGHSDYSTRLGNLMTMCDTFREGNLLFNEFFRMQVKIFDLYVTETLLTDLIL